MRRTQQTNQKELEEDVICLSDDLSARLQGQSRIVEAEEEEEEEVVELDQEEKEEGRTPPIILDDNLEQQGREQYSQGRGYSCRLLIEYYCTYVYLH